MSSAGRGRGRGRRPPELEQALNEYRLSQRGANISEEEGLVAGSPAGIREGRTRGIPPPMASSQFSDSPDEGRRSSSSSCSIPSMDVSPIPSSNSPVSSSTSPPVQSRTEGVFRGLGRGRGFIASYGASTESPGLDSPVITRSLREVEPVFEDTGEPVMSRSENLVAQFGNINLAPATTARVMGRGRAVVIPISTDEAQEPPLNLPFGRGRGRGRGLGIIFDNLVPGTVGISNPTSVVSSGAASRPPTVYAPSTSLEVGVEDYSTVESEIVVRKGKNGLMIPVVANFIRLGVEKDAGMFEFHVDFEPFLESFRVRRAVMKRLSDSGEISKTRNFDGAKLYLPHRLPQNITRLSCVHPFDENETVEAVIKFVKENRMGDSIHFYNILFRRIMEKIGLVEVNRHFYNYKKSYHLPAHRLEIWPGFVTAIDEAEGGLVLCCDVSHRVLRTTTLLTALNDIYSRCNGNFNAVQAEFSNYAVGQVVLTKYNNKHYKVDDIDWTQNPRDTFEKKNGERISYVDYYWNEYRVNITDLEQPLLIHRPKVKVMVGNQRESPPGLVCLIPELCFITGLSEDITENHRIMKDIGEHTRLTPENRNKSLVDFVQTVKSNQEANEMLASWGLTLDDQTINLNARQIAPPSITFNEQVTIPGSHDFAPATSKHQCFDPISVKHWIIFCTPHDRDKAANLISNYRAACRNIGIQFMSDPAVIIVHASGHGRLKEEFRRSIADQLRNKSLQFVVIILPRPQDDMYAMVKQLCCVECPIPSQVILSKTLADSKKLRTVVSKIALQINCKLGGSLWTIRIPLVEKIMFVGMDVYHDPKGRSQSVTALVASINHTQTKYYSRILKQAAHQETIDSLRAVFFDSLRVFREECGGWPDRILVFRDGVGDGQLQTTKQHEVVQMLETIARFCENKPKFSFTVVQKRINCRIFLREEGTRKLVNPQPGTVLDHTVTRRSYFDFFLVSQLVRQGTVSPTHYIVLEDNTNIEPDLIQKFAFATSYMYYNWAGPIRVPAVCQYAHKLAFLVGQYIKADPSATLQKKIILLVILFWSEAHGWIKKYSFPLLISTVPIRATSVTWRTSNRRVFGR